MSRCHVYITSASNADLTCTILLYTIHILISWYDTSRIGTRSTHLISCWFIPHCVDTKLCNICMLDYTCVFLPVTCPSRVRHVSLRVRHVSSRVRHVSWRHVYTLIPRVQKYTHYTSSYVIKYEHVYMLHNIWYMPIQPGADQCLGCDALQFTDSSSTVNRQFADGLSMVHCRFTYGSLTVHWQFTDSLLTVHRLFTGGSLTVRWLFTDGSLTVHWRFNYFTTPLTPEVTSGASTKSKFVIHRRA